MTPSPNATMKTNPKQNLNVTYNSYFDSVPNKYFKFYLRYYLHNSSQVNKNGKHCCNI